MQIEQTTQQPISEIKWPFDIEEMFRRIEEAIKEYKKAALFELVEAGYSSAFEILVACILSTRTRDEVTVPTAKRLFALARTPKEMAQLTPQQIDAVISACTYHRAKSYQIHQAAKQVVEQYKGALPCKYEVLTRFRGVGPKCANLTLALVGQGAGADATPTRGREQGEEGGEIRGIGVDVHVHRVVNRWGYVREVTVKGTMKALEQKLPREYWLKINELLVPFGKHICTRKKPRCSACPVLRYCHQIAVTDPR